MQHGNSETLFNRNTRSASFDDPYRGRKKIEASAATATLSAPSRFQITDPVIQSLFKKNGDTELFMSSEVNKVNNVMKFQKRLMIITDKFLYNMHPKTFQVKRAISIEKISKIQVSELRDDFLFIHVDNERDYLFNTDKKTEIIQVLKLSKREKIPAHMRVSSWYADGELEVMVGNNFHYSPEKSDVKIPVEITFDETLQYKDQVIDYTKDKLTIRLMKEENRLFAIESITMELKDFGSSGNYLDSVLPLVETGASMTKTVCDKCFDEDIAIHYCVNCKENLCDLHSRAHQKDKASRSHEIQIAQQPASSPSPVTPVTPVTPRPLSEPNLGPIRVIDVTEDSGVLPISSPKAEYQLVVRFKVYRPMEDFKIIQTTSGKTKKKQITNVGSIQLYSSDMGREKFKRMEIKLDPVTVTSTFSGNVKVSIQFQEKMHKKPPLFKSYFTYSCASKKRFSIWK